MTHLLSLQKRLILATVVFTLLGSSLSAKGKLTLSGRIVDSDGKNREIELICRLDSIVEVDYFYNGGILQTVLRQMNLQLKFRRFSLLQK